MKYGRFYELTQPLADELSFVARAISVDETRYFLRFLRVEKTGDGGMRAVGTDGRRLHMIKQLHKNAEVAGLEPGAYRVLRRSPKLVQMARVDDADAGTFPPYQKILDMCDGNARWQGAWCGIRLDHDYRFNSSLFAWFYRLPEPTAVNLLYLKDLGDHAFIARWYSPDKALAFESDTRLAIMMPMHMDEPLPGWSRDPVAEVPA